MVRGLIHDPAKKSHATGLSIVAAICIAPAATAGDVRVRMEGLRNTDGALRVAVCEEASFLQSTCAHSASAPASRGLVLVPDVPSGRYAVQAFHDENANGALDRSALGRPREGMAFSRDARMRFGPPSYSEAAVIVPENDADLTMKMRYFQ